MSDIWPGSCLMGLLCAQLTLMGRQSALLFRHYHCYDYRAAYLNPHMIHKTLKNKNNENDFKEKGIRTDHPASHYTLLDFQPEDDKTAYSEEFRQNK